MVNNIIEFCNYFRRIFINYNENKETIFTEQEEDRIKKLKRDIFYYMLWNPGALLEFNDKNDMKIAKIILNVIWEDIVIDSEIHEDYKSSEKIFLSEHDTFDDLLYSAISRLKMLKPTYIIKYKNDYNQNFKAYYKEAMSAWLYGLNNAAIVLCCAIL